MTYVYILADRQVQNAFDTIGFPNEQADGLCCARSAMKGCGLIHLLYIGQIFWGSVFFCHLQHVGRWVCSSHLISRCPSQYVSSWIQPWMQASHEEKGLNVCQRSGINLRNFTLVEKWGKHVTLIADSWKKQHGQSSTWKHMWGQLIVVSQSWLHPQQMWFKLMGHQ